MRAGWIDTLLAYGNSQSCGAGVRVAGGGVRVQLAGGAGDSRVRCIEFRGKRERDRVVARCIGREPGDPVGSRGPARSGSVRRQRCSGDGVRCRGRASQALGGEFSEGDGLGEDRARVAERRLVLGLWRRRRGGGRVDIGCVEDPAPVGSDQRNMSASGGRMSAVWSWALSRGTRRPRTTATGTRSTLFMTGSVAAASSSARAMTVTRSS